MKAKSVELYEEIQPDVKEQAENILSALGISASNAINMFYKQIIFYNGIPFDVSLPTEKLLSIGNLSKKELDAELDKGYQDMIDKRVKPAEQIFNDIQ